MTTNHKIKILVVDDSEVILSSLKSFFEEFEIEVLTCSDGLEGIKISAECKPDLIFLDLMMPDFDGIKMLQVKNVLKDIKDIPVIVISANTARRNVLAAIDAGAVKVVSKPLQKDQILNYTAELLGESIFQAKTGSFGENTKSKMKQDLTKLFLDTYPEKRKTIKEAIMTKNVDLLKSTIHDIRGAGGTIGVPEITEIASQIEDKEIKSPTDWVFVEFKCNELYQEVMKLSS